MKHALLLMLLLLTGCSTTPSGAPDTAPPVAAQSPDEGTLGDYVASDGDEGAAKPPKGAQVAFRVSGMKKTKSGATWVGWPDKVTESLEGTHSTQNITWDYSTDVVTITYDDKKTNPEKLAAVIAVFEYGVKEVPVVMAESQHGFTPFPAPLPDDAPRAFAVVFEAARSASKPIVIDFWATWCAPCVQLKQKTLAAPDVVTELEGTEVIFVNVDEHPELAKVYGVSSIPDVFFVNAEGQVVDRLKAFEDPRPFIERLQKMKSKKVKVATLGVSTAVPSDEAAESLELTNKVRVLGRVVTKVLPESPAAQAGLKVDDVLLRLGSNDIYSADDIADFLSVSKPGDKVALSFKRPGSAEARETSVTFGEVDQAASTGPRLVWQYSSLGQLPQALEEARAKKKKVLVGLSGAET